MSPNEHGHEIHEDEAPIPGHTSEDHSSEHADSSALPGEHASFAQQQHQQHPRPDAPGDGDGESMDEREMRRHFMDVESSFLPDGGPGLAAPQGQEGLVGVDDTYLELGGVERTSLPRDRTGVDSRSSEARLQPDDGDEHREDSGTSIVEHEDADGDEDGHERAGELDDSDSTSPAAAAAYRTHVRNVSTASAARTESLRATTMSTRLGIGSPPQTPSQRSTSTSSARPTSKGSTIRPEPSPAIQEAARPSTNSDSLLSSPDGRPVASPPFVGRRAQPNHIHSRHTSHHSTLSSTSISSELSGSEAAFNSDYALQSGGAVSTYSLLRGSRAAHILSRLPSPGSVASYADGDSDPDGLPKPGGGVVASGSAGRFGGRFRGLSEAEDRPETPRANVPHVQAPTDTVLAQRVESIHVPETVARDFRARNRSLSPNRRPASSSGPGASFADRPRRTLTLKEQNSKIDKLTKESFDLKLKIHFLDQALQSRSDDGVKELIDKNVALQTDLANERKETQNLRRRVRELERKSQEQEESLNLALQQKKRDHDDGEDDDPILQAEMHEEILYLRQQLDHSENQVTTLREEVMTKELEKRKMAEHMRSMASTRGDDAVGTRQTLDAWQELLDAESGRREQAEDDMRKLREELTALRMERASPAVNREAIISKRRGRFGPAPNADEEFDFANEGNGAYSEASSTLVGQLKNENAELRRDLGAQTSMLTSRNRERERLQQEIEDLKLLQRKSDGARSVAGESIFERSVSRAHQRVSSRASDYTHVAEAERDDWDRKEGQLRDQNAELRLKYQELERTHNTHLTYVAAVESDFQELEQELNDAADDLRALQTERDEALHACEDREAEYEKLEQEALMEIDKWMNEVDSLRTQLQEEQKRAQKTQTKLEHATDGYRGIQNELREITQSVMNLEDEKQANVRTIQTLEQQLAEAEDEIQKWEQKCKELDEKNRKLDITQESLNSEITFLREEQEGDKIKIGELEDSLNAALQTIQDEQEKLREMEEVVVEERQQRDVLENKSKEEVQKVLDDLNNEAGRTKDEVRKLRRALSAKEVESSSWKQRLDELESSLRSALGNPQGSKQTLLGEIDRMQRDLEATANQLDRAKMEAADKDRLLRHRDGLLESTSLESRRLSDLLDKERASRKRDLEQFEKSSRGQASHLRHAAQQESRILELETAFSQDKRKMAAQEQSFRDQLTERNNLLLALWHRLSTICGGDWAQSHCLVNGEMPSAEVISRSLPGFHRNVIAAVKTIEALLGSFKSRIRGIEKDLWRDYQTLEHNLEMRIRRMDGLETAVRDAQQQQQQQQRAIAEEPAAPPSRPPTSRSASSKSLKGGEELSKLKHELRALKAELKLHRQHPSPLAQQMLNNQQHQLHAEHARRQSSTGSLRGKSGGLMAQLLRHHSTSSAIEQLPAPSEEDAAAVADDAGSDAGGRAAPSPLVLAPAAPPAPSEQRWIHRLKELERRLKAEREGRVLDRKGARQRLEEGRLENEELRLMLEREKVWREHTAEPSLVGSEMVPGEGEGGE